jgi:hypothetical protein
MLPLEPGCKAMVTKGIKAGTTVTCISHIGKPSPDDIHAKTKHDCWEIDTPMPWTSITGRGATIMLDIFPTQYLMRIDGDYEHKEQDATVNKILERIT